MRDRWRVATAAHEENETGYVFDGDGRPVIEKEGMRSIIGLNPDPMVICTEGYQVWSTVLGASLTTVNTVGNKRHTKVFAGGAHIATQDANGTTSTGDDRILFTSADPVTGTKVTFNYTDGTSYFAREDTEPARRSADRKKRPRHRLPHLQVSASAKTASKYARTLPKSDLRLESRGRWTV